MKRRKTSADMGFSAMLAEEYKLIDISVIGCGTGWTNNVNAATLSATRETKRL